jgi:hypothetical protein
VVVIAVILGAVLFGVLLGYLAWTNDSFPSRTKPFTDYARVVSASFNGTEYAFTIQWLDAQYQPQYSQLAADQDAGNTVVCGFGTGRVESGQTIFMPFGLPAPTPVLTNVHLYIAVNSASGGDEFTIVYDVTSVTAQGGDILPSNVACQQPSGAM